MLVILDDVPVESWPMSFVASGVPEVNKSTTTLHVAPEVPSKYPQNQDCRMSPRITLSKGANGANGVLFNNTYS